MSLQSRLATLISAIGADIKALQQSTGWQSTSVAFTYSSADSPTFVATTGSNLTALISVGSRIKLTNSTVKYFIVTAIDATTITLYGGTDYALTNTAISAVSYSMVKAPVGFPLNPDKWTVDGTNLTAQAAKTSPVASTWYGDTGLSPTGPSISIPIGCWRVMYEAEIQIVQAASDTNVEVYSTLSAASNTESDKKWTAYFLTGDAAAAGKLVAGFVHRENIVDLAAKSTRYLNVMQDSGGSPITINGSVCTTTIRAVCAYL